MWVRTSIRRARVASSIVVLDVPGFAAPAVPVAPGVDVEGVDEVVSFPTISLMILSAAATSVPQLAFALVDFPALLLGSAVLAFGLDPIFSRLVK